MTEADACQQYEKHVSTCHEGCKPSRGLLCRRGMKLHNQWKAQESRQPVTSGRRK